VSHADGTDPVQLTSFESTAGTPRWSPDGRRILFDSRGSGSYDLYTVDARGGAPQRLTHEPSDENAGTWSRDGAWIYFSSNQTGRRQTWKMPTEGGDAVQLTRGGGFYAEASRDGRDVYFCRSAVDGTVWRVPAEGGEEIEVLRGPNSKDSWTLSVGGIYFTTWAWGLRAVDPLLGGPPARVRADAGRELPLNAVGFGHKTQRPEEAGR